ncbi:MAG: alpha/beta hydrolase fold domain-containing protein, partial [Succinivibrio sp.]
MLRRIVASFFVLIFFLSEALALTSEQLSVIDPELRDQAPYLVFNYDSLEASIEFDKNLNTERSPEFNITVVQGNENNSGVESMIFYPNEDSPEDAYPTVFFCHGGGYLFRALYYKFDRFQKIADTLKSAVVVVRYPLLFERPFPAAIKTFYQSMLYFKGNASKYRLDGDRISLIGESAGGNLAAALCLYNKDQSNIKIDFLGLLYPMLDYKTGTSVDTEDDPLTGQIVWNRSSNAFAWKMLSKGIKFDDKTLGYYSPLYAKSLDGFPYTAIYVG